jgi:hypothetical protein
VCQIIAITEELLGYGNKKDRAIVDHASTIINIQKKLNSTIAL